MSSGHGVPRTASPCGVVRLDQLQVSRARLVPRDAFVDELRDRGGELTTGVSRHVGENAHACDGSWVQHRCPADNDQRGEKDQEPESILAA